MLNKSQVNSSLISIPVASLVIVTFLILQALTALRIFCFFKMPCDPYIYPFLSYPMYKGAKKPGSIVTQLNIFGILEDLSEVSITNQDLKIPDANLNPYWFRRYYIPAIRGKKNKVVKNQVINEFVDIYQKQYNKKLIGIRLEKQSFVISKEEIKPQKKITEYVKF
ncbi:MAG: hypothetical protein F6K23_34505 [Okeania sp. SIO2C9]|uniref:hypothetical protein n=1 Tax=Okeania sp. SIO2C9 TaxID=2607791 RepID=UPI0013BFC846|nr:hypothetical protein [Okeania sp. SIO2C9]NEQ77680.1 hypothetical protein [Okeania sp. SIO2C9]